MGRWLSDEEREAIADLWRADPLACSYRIAARAEARLGVSVSPEQARAYRPAELPPLRPGGPRGRRGGPR